MDYKLSVFKNQEKIIFPVCIFFMTCDKFEL